MHTVAQPEACTICMQELSWTTCMHCCSLQESLCVQHAVLPIAADAPSWAKPSKNSVLRLALKVALATGIGKLCSW